MKVAVFIALKGRYGVEVNSISANTRFSISRTMSFKDKITRKNYLL